MENLWKTWVFFSEQAEMTQSSFELVWVVSTVSCDRVYADERDDVRVPVIPLKWDIMAEKGGKTQGANGKQRASWSTPQRALWKRHWISVSNPLPGDEIQSQKSGLMRNKLALVASAATDTRGKADKSINVHRTQ